MEMTNDYIREQKIFALNEKAKSGLITDLEKKELMVLLYQNGSISQKQFDNYKIGKNTSELLKMALTISAIVAVGYLIDKALNSK